MTLDLERIESVSKGKGNKGKDEEEKEENVRGL